MKPLFRCAARTIPLGLVLFAGCGLSQPGAGLTNGPPPGSTEKPAIRTDLPEPAPPKRGEILGELGDNATNAGTAGRSPDGATSGTTPKPR
jgi:hypothetical protein